MASPKEEALKAVQAHVQGVQDAQKKLADALKDQFQAAALKGGDGHCFECGCPAMVFGIPLLQDITRCYREGCGHAAVRHDINPFPH